MNYHIILQQTAESDLDRIYRYIAKMKTRNSATRWRDSIYRSINTLKQNPLRCPEAPEATTLGFDLRELLSGKRPHVYRILFVVMNDTVTIISIRHAAQDQLSIEDIEQ